MKLTIRQAAAVLNVPETKVYRWVDEGDIPHVTIQHRPLFDRLELLEWAMENDVPIAVDLYEVPTEAPLAHALERGGGHVMLGSGLPQVADDLPIAPDHRAVLAAVLAARRDEMFQNRNGVAIPRPRSPLIYPDLPTMVQLWWPRDQPLAIDDAPAKALFVIVSRTMLDHLQLIARLSLVLRDAAFEATVKRASSLEEIIVDAKRVEQGLAVTRRRER